MKLVLSNSSRGAFDGVFSEIEQKLKNGEKCVVITTDRLTATVERALLQKLEGDAVFGLRVSSFTRLAAITLGNDVKKCLTPEGSVMLITDVIEKHRDELCYYGKVKPDELASELYAAITALRNSGISTEKLMSSDLGSKNLNDKAKDIAVVYGGYLQALEGRHSDSGTRLESLASRIENGEPLNENYFVIDMTEFNYAQLNVLKAIDKRAISLTIGLTSGFDNPNKRIYPDKTARRLEALADGKTEIVIKFDTLTPVGDVIGKYLFSYVRPPRSVLPKKAEIDKHLKLRSALTRDDEVLALALDIVKGVREGRRYRDYEVFVGDLDGYTPIVKSVFLRYGIPFFIDRKEMLYEQTKTRYLLSAVAAVRSKMRADEVMDFVKNPLFKSLLDGETEEDKQDEIFIFENYVLEFGVNYGGFYKTFEYGDEEYRKKADAVRMKLISALSVFDIGKKRSADFAAAARKLLADADGGWKTHVKNIAKLSEYYEKCAEQVDDKLSSVLDEIENVLDGEYDIAGFESLLKGMFRTLKISLVPTFLDCVFIGDSSSSFLCSGDLYVVGANSGLIPQESAGGAVLTPSDEELFERAGVELYSDRKDKIRTELFTITEIMKKTRGTLTVSYADSAPLGKLRPSSVVTQLETIFGTEDGSFVEVEEVRYDDLYRSYIADKPDEIAPLFATEKACMNEVLSRSKDIGTGANIPIYRTAKTFLNKEDEERLERAYGFDTHDAKLSSPPAVEHSSVSRLERFFSCPYSYYLQYVLKIRPREEGEIMSNENGSILHAVFEKFFRALSEGKVNENDIEEIAGSAFDEYVAETPKLARLIEDKKTKRALMKLRVEGIKTCKDLYKISLRSKFIPTYVEANFGGKEGFNPVIVDAGDKKVTLTGRIDRVDVHDDKFLIIDYKTFKGATIDAKDVYYGKKLQLYVYAKAIADSLNKKPAGLFYLPVYPSYVKEGENRYKYKGQVLADIDVMNAIDDLTEEDNNATVVPCGAKDRTKLSDCLSEEELRLRGEYAVKLAGQGAKLINEGYVSPRPFKSTASDNPCANCTFKDVCPYKGKFARIAENVSKDAFDIDGERTVTENE